MKSANYAFVFSLVLCLTMLQPVLAEEQGVGVSNTVTKEKVEKIYPKKPSYSPYVGRNFPTRPLFGDTHLHTGYSMDAGAFGARLTPVDAYRFARGEELQSNTGQPVKLSRPLDFLVVADHSDGMGFFPLLMGGDPTLLATEQGRKWHDGIKGEMALRWLSTSSEVSAETNFLTASLCLEQRPTARPGSKPLRLPKNITILAALPPS